MLPLLDISEYQGEDRAAVLAGYKLALATPQSLREQWSQVVKLLMVNAYPENPYAEEDDFLTNITACALASHIWLTDTEIDLICAYFKACMPIWKVAGRLRGESLRTEYYYGFS
jgi:hypothetical protein